jgi:hypothetical protein
MCHSTGVYIAKFEETPQSLFSKLNSDGCLEISNDSDLASILGFVSMFSRELRKMEMRAEFLSRSSDKSLIASSEEPDNLLLGLIAKNQLQAKNDALEELEQARNL